MSQELYTKKLCMTELHVSRCRFEKSHYFDSGIGKVNSSFGYVIKGGVTLSSPGKRIHVEEGGLFFIPEGIRYSSMWQGSPEIEYYALDIVSKKVDITDTAAVHALQKIDALSCAETGERIREIFELFSTGERLKMIRAVGLYYCLYAEILPLLAVEPPVKYNPALIAAIDYIDKNYAVEFTMEELSAVCCVSQSRLFHLFRSELGTTPVRYRNEIRIERAASDLRSCDLSIDEIAQKNGFNTAAHFRETFKSCTGLTPTEYRTLCRKIE